MTYCLHAERDLTIVGWDLGKFIGDVSHDSKEIVDILLVWSIVCLILLLWRRVWWKAWKSWLLVLVSVRNSTREAGEAWVTDLDVVVDVVRVLRCLKLHAAEAARELVHVALFIVCVGHRVG